MSKNRMARQHRLHSMLLALGCVLLAGCSGSGGNSRAQPAGATLAAVKARGYVRCGSNEGTLGFAAPDSRGYWRGLDVDTCRAVAAAVLGDREKARFVPLTGQQRLAALQTGEIDMLPRTTTWTLPRDAAGINFTVTNFYDYTGFMVRRDSGVRSLRDMEGASICIQTGSTSEIAFADIDRKYRLHMHPVIFESVAATSQAFFSRRCDALITDASGLASVRATRTRRPDDYIIFPADDAVSALTPAVRHGDDQWFDIVKFAIQAMLTAEQLGIDSHNVDRLRSSRNPVIRRFLGLEPGNGAALGLSEDWAYRIIRQVGNYAEVYDRNVGKDSKLKIDRGLNRLQRDGGVMIPLPFN
jgi:general L-amino acid transport system substrate-binding protein